MLTLRIILRANADRLTLCALGAAFGALVAVTAIYVRLCYTPDSSAPF